MLRLAPISFDPKSKDLADTLKEGAFHRIKELPLDNTREVRLRLKPFGKISAIVWVMLNHPDAVTAKAIEQFPNLTYYRCGNTTEANRSTALFQDLPVNTYYYLGPATLALLLDKPNIAAQLFRHNRDTLTVGCQAKGVYRALLKLHSVHTNLGLPPPTKETVTGFIAEICALSNPSLNRDHALCIQEAANLELLDYAAIAPYYHQLKALPDISEPVRINAAKAHIAFCSAQHRNRGITPQGQ